MNTSTVGIIAIEHLDAANALSIALGHSDGAPTFTCPLAPEGATEPTHYAWHSPVSPGFLAQLADAQAGNWPDGVDPVEAAPVIAAQELSFMPNGIEDEPQNLYGADHLNYAAAKLGLVRFVDEPEEPA